jgi:hypothetical protein
MVVNALQLLCHTQTTSLCPALRCLRAAPRRGRRTLARRPASAPEYSCATASGVSAPREARCVAARLSCVNCGWCWRQRCARCLTHAMQMATTEYKRSFTEKAPEFSPLRRRQWYSFQAGRCDAVRAVARCAVPHRGNLIVGVQ